MTKDHSSERILGRLKFGPEELEQTRFMIDAPHQQEDSNQVEKLKHFCLAPEFMHDRRIQNLFDWSFFIRSQLCF